MSGREVCRGVGCASARLESCARLGVLTIESGTPSPYTGGNGRLLFASCTTHGRVGGLLCVGALAHQTCLQTYLQAYDESHMPTPLLGGSQTSAGSTELVALVHACIAGRESRHLAVQRMDCVK